jgi:hypothetical protein
LLPLLNDAGVRPHVILNDYANADLDSATLREWADDVRSLTGSCICCDARERLFEMLAGLELGERDVVLLETNGTTDPLPLLETRKNMSVNNLCRRQFLRGLGLAGFGVVLGAVPTFAAPGEVKLPAKLRATIAVAKLDRARWRHIVCLHSATPTFEEAQAIVANAVAAKVRFMVHENFRFQPWHREIKRLLEARAIGRVHSLAFRSRFERASPWQL